MIYVLDDNGRVVHMANKHTHYTVCGVARLGGRRGKPLRKVKDRPPSCLFCLTHGMRDEDIDFSRWWR